MKKTVAVYGAYGHTGAFIVAQLCEKGFDPLLCGRDEEKLGSFAKQYPGLSTKVADIHQPDSLDSAFSQVELIVNCAGPFLDSAEPIIQSALRLGKHYIDVSAEQKSVLDVFEHFSAQAQRAQISIIPAAAFYGGLADLLSTSLTQDWEEIDAITTYIGLSSWHPTTGTKITGQRNQYPRVVLTGGQLTPLRAGASVNWHFPEPLAAKEMIEVPFSEIITISKHLHVRDLHTYLSLNAIQDIRKPETPAPQPADDKNRSSQQFCMEVVATRRNTKRTITAQGRDIYAVTAPLVVEAVRRVLAGNIKNQGVAAMGAAFEAVDFLHSLNSDDISISQIQESVNE